eukprot:TRINITY_DN9432_c0_g1_i1.p1 TRINITY_DN9432_c0_g1~~TRINITY_DN9432_c0_g1_i1.p1  ORF type:complete len:834 (-),score=120.30 TRINITY_DN9432_c0_g1_i1:240-2741(-)
MTKYPETSSDPNSWGAMCKLRCDDQIAPFGCAVNHCLNEDYPCKWVDGCLPKGLMRTSSACMRSCVEHEDKMKFLYGVDTCKEAIDRFGCTSWHAIPDFCPVGCKSMECPFRCNRDEVPNLQNRRCWQVVQEDGMSCLSAIRQGQDCSCKCGHFYMSLSGKAGRANGGAFAVTDKYMGQDVHISMNVTAGRKFTVDLTGEGMSETNVGGADGPRLKIIEGERCDIAAVHPTVSGLVCQAPLNGDMLKQICTTAPQKATFYFHRWTSLTVNGCGDYTICHCNKNCDKTINWNRAGYLFSRPIYKWGSMANPLPGCNAYLPTLAPELLASSNVVENHSPSRISMAFSVSGGLPPLDRALTGIKKSLINYLKTPSKLLQKEVPELSDVTVELFVGRRLRSLPSARRTAGCADDDAAFQKEAAKANLNVKTCAEAMKLLGGSVAKLCDDQTLVTAVTKGCQKTCNLCDPSLFTTTTTAPSNLTAVSNNTVDVPKVAEIVWPSAAGTDALRITSEVYAKTDWTGTQFMSKLEEIKTNPSVFLQGLYKELQNAGMLQSEIPSNMWVFVANGPVRTIIPTPAPEEPPEPIWKTNAIIFIAAGVALGGACLCSLIAALAWCYMTAEYTAQVGVESKTEVQTSEFGYRQKKIHHAGQEHISKPLPKPKCCERLLNRIKSRLCPKRELRRIAPIDEAAPGQGLTLGARVRLVGLSQAHFNGLEGFITDGPNEKGRYTVEVVVDDDHSAREIQTLSFKPDNLKALKPEFMGQNPDSPKSEYLGEYLEGADPAQYGHDVNFSVNQPAFAYGQTEDPMYAFQQNPQMYQQNPQMYQQNPQMYQGPA